MGLGLGADRFISKQGSIRSILKAIDELSTGGIHQRRSDSNGDHNLAPANTENKIFNARLVRQLEQNSIETQQARAELAKLNNDLEARVKQRTSQLEIFNTQLEQWVSDRTDELAKRMRF